MFIVRITVLALLLGLTVLGILQNLQESRQRRPVVDPTKSRTIPLETIQTTFPQPGTRVFSFERFRMPESSNLCLVSGNTIHEAKVAARRVFSMQINANELVGPDARSEGGPVWFVVYLGEYDIASSRLPVHSAIVDNRRIKLYFTPRSQQEDSKSLSCPFIFVPLGRLQPGRYSLELIEHGSGKHELIRYVTIRSS